MAQDRLLVDAVWSAIETLRTRAVALQEIRAVQSRAGIALSEPDHIILHWAELEVEAGAIQGVRQSARNPAWKLGPDPAVFESHYLSSVLPRLNLSELKENGVSVLRLKQESAQGAEWLIVAFPTRSASRVVLALVDPADAFPIFQRWTARSEGGKLRGYLVGTDGFVLAHSQKAYIGSNFSTTGVFREGVNAMLQGQTVRGVGEHRAIDGTTVTVSYARPGTLPIAAVVERVMPPPVPTLAQSPLAVQGIGLLLMIWLGCAMGLKGFVRRFAAIDVVEVDEPVFEMAAEKLASLQNDAPPREEARRMAETSAKLIGSPTLYFEYRARGRSAVLSAWGGFEGVESPTLESIAFPLGDELLERIYQYERDGKAVSLADDPSLRLLLARRFGPQRWEAWPVMDTDGRLLGILASRSTKSETLGKIVKNLKVPESTLS